jgi:hypothetical protein
MAKAIIHNSDYPSVEAGKKCDQSTLQGAKRFLSAKPEARRTKDLGTGAGAK